MPPDSASHRTWYAEQALLPAGWARDVCLTVDAAGDLVEVAAGAARRESFPSPSRRWMKRS